MRSLKPGLDFPLVFRKLATDGIWENTALYIGPVVSYRQEKWWAALTVMPQVFGANFHGNPGGNSWLELEAHERVNIRLVIGISL